MTMFFEDSAIPIIPRAALSALIVMEARPGGAQDRQGKGGKRQ